MAHQPVRVGTIDGWYVGDQAWLWITDRRKNGIDGMFGAITKVEISGLYDSHAARVAVDISDDPERWGDTYELNVPTSKLVKPVDVRAFASIKFPAGTKVVMLVPTPEVGATATVITTDEAKREGFSDPKFIHARLDDDRGGYVGGWVPEHLGIAELWERDDAALAEIAPKNNDGRDKCYWCGAPTQTIELATSSGHVCTACRR